MTCVTKQPICLKLIPHLLVILTQNLKENLPGQRTPCHVHKGSLSMQSSFQCQISKKMDSRFHSKPASMFHTAATAARRLASIAQYGKLSLNPLLSSSSSMACQGHFLLRTTSTEPFTTCTRHQCRSDISYTAITSTPNSPLGQ